jgi:hypothetical protein
MGYNSDKYCREEWYNETVDARRKYIEKRLELYYKEYDDEYDLTSAIKDGVVGKIFFSENAMSMLMNEWETWWGCCSEIDKQVMIEIRNTGCYEIITEHGGLRCDGLKLYDSARAKWNTYINQKYPGKEDEKTRERLSLYCEHVIPTSVYKKRLKELYKRFGKLDLEDFKSVMNIVSICYILKSESEKLPTLGWKWGDAPFARYANAGIKVWGQD